MADFDVSYEEKSKKMIVECPNVFDGLRKGCKDVLLLNALQAYVEIPIDDGLSDGKSVAEAVKGKLQDTKKSVIKEVDDLIESLRKLQKEEKQGNKKAATEGEKLVKDAEKSIKKWAGEFGAEVRKVVQKEAKSKEKLRSASRTNFRGMELSDEAFDGSAEGSEPPAYVGELAKSLSALGKEAHKLSEQEKDTRRDLALEIERVQKLVEQARAGKKDFDIQEFLKANSKEGRPLELSAGKYIDFLVAFKEKLEEASDKRSRLDKLVDKDKKLSEDKSLGKLIDEYGAKSKIVEGTLPEKKTAAEQAKRLFKDDYGDGSGWKKLIADLGRFKGAAKSAGAMKDSGADLEKALKA